MSLKWHGLCSILGQQWWELQKLSEEGQVTNRLQGFCHPRLIDAHGQRRLTQVTHNFTDVMEGMCPNTHNLHHNLLWRLCYGLLENPAIHVDIHLTCDTLTYLNIVADQVNPFMTMVFPDGCGLFRQDNAPCHTVQKGFREHYEESCLSHVRDL